MPDQWKKSLDDFLRSKQRDIIALRRHLHAHPEPSGAEHQTSMHLYQLLGKLQLDVRLGPDGCGVIAENRSAPDGPPQRIAVRADIDALLINDEKQVPYRSTVPGVMHACGHDAHAAILWGLCVALEYLQTSEQLPWPVAWRAIFQPAEETATGARQMLANGVLDGVERIMALHIEPARRTGEIALRTGAMTASCDSVYLSVVGAGGHAARPHQSRDPIAAAAQVINALYQFIPRSTDTHDAVVLTFGSIRGGTNPNVIPDSVTLQGTLRTLDPEVRTKTIDKIQQVVRGIEAITGTRIELEYQSSIPCVLNEALTTSLIWRAAEEVVGTPNVQLITKPSMGSEDFACYLQCVPGALFRLGCAADLAAPTPLHTPRFDIDEQALELGVRVMARALVAACEPIAATS